MTILRSQIIFRPPEEVFHFYAVDHIENHPRWDPDMNLEKETLGPIGVGTIIKRRHNRSGTEVVGFMEVTAFEANRIMSVAIDDGSMKMSGSAEFEPLFDGHGTMLTLRVNIPGMEDKFDSTLIERSLNNMKQLIEQ